MKTTFVDPIYVQDYNACCSTPPARLSLEEELEETDAWAREAIPNLFSNSLSLREHPDYCFDPPIVTPPVLDCTLTGACSLLWGVWANCVSDAIDQACLEQEACYEDYEDALLACIGQVPLQDCLDDALADYEACLSLVDNRFSTAIYTCDQGLRTRVNLLGCCD